MSFTSKLFRRKVVDTSPSNLSRSLKFWDLTALGIGSTLGSGAYVLTGIVAKESAGPAIVLCFFISGLASIFSGLCYAEFSTRVPRAGSAYIYSYVTVGEVLAWITGWQLLLEYVLGTSAVARAWSGYLDSLVGHKISQYMTEKMGTWDIPGFADRPDFIAMIMTLVLTGIVCLGVQESAKVNNLLTGINVLVISFAIIAGSFFASTENFTPFAPYGTFGVFKGAATVFYAYVGFDIIATSAEEVVNPSKTMPKAIIFSLLACAIIYMAVSTVITGMIPYLELDVSAPLSEAFGYHGASWAKYIVSIGAVCGLSTALMNCIFPMPRIVYAIAQDGLMPTWLSKISSKYNTPLNATVASGVVAAIMAFIFDISALANLMSVGTLMAYTIVAFCVLVLRYREYEESEDSSNVASTELTRSESYQFSNEDSSNRLSASFSVSRPLLRRDSLASSYTYTFLGMRAYKAASACIGVFSLGTIIASIGGSKFFEAKERTMSGESSIMEDWEKGLFYTLIVVGLAIVSIAIYFLLKIPSKVPYHLDFRVPLMPWVPLISIAVNIYLMVSLDPTTWIRFGIWCVLGAFLYLTYGINHSNIQQNAQLGALESGSGKVA